MTRKTLFLMREQRPPCRGLAAGVLAIVAGVAAAQSYPSGPMRIVSPYPPGGGTDLLARAIGQRITERYGFPVIVDNRPGANGTIGTGVAAKAPPDGHTMVIVAAAYAAGSSLYKSLPYDPYRDLAPVSLLASGPLVLVVHPSLRAKSVRVLVALA
jgi:tripartite-type tricarboxylate transporter receptor subunit TctC